MTVTPLYAGLLSLLFVALSIRVIGARRLSRVEIGDGGDPALLRRQRVHGNFAEYVPLALVLLALAELKGAAPALLHGLGLALLVGRTVHAVGVSREPERIALRVTGMALTFAVIVSAALMNLGIAGLLGRFAGG